MSLCLGSRRLEGGAKKVPNHLHCKTVYGFCTCFAGSEADHDLQVVMDDLCVASLHRPIVMHLPRDIDIVVRVRVGHPEGGHSLSDAQVHGDAPLAQLLDGSRGRQVWGCANRDPPMVGATVLAVCAEIAPDALSHALGRGGTPILADAIALPTHHPQQQCKVIKYQR